MQTLSTRKPEFDEELLRMFRKVEINIPLLDAIKQIPKYAKFLKELCMHKRKKMKGGVEVRGIVSALTRNEDFTLPKKCRDPEIFSVPCTIGDYTFVDDMLDLGTSINVMPTSIYKSLNFGDLEPTGMTIQLANRSIVQSLGVLEDVLVQVNEMIFPTDFYVLDMEDETSGKGYTLILGRPFLMTTRTKIDVHAETLSMEFGDTLVQFNIFEAMKHPTKDHSLFGIDMLDLKIINDNSSSLPPPMELKPLLSHLKYAYLGTKQQLPVIIANNLHQEQHKKVIGWKLSDLLGINPSICMHRILMEEEARPIMKQKRILNPTILDVVKKEVTKLLVVGIIYPISDNQWVSPVQVVLKKSRMTVMKNQHAELVPMWIQNSWRVCIDYRRLNQATRKDHFPLPFIDQVLEKLARKSHYYFLDGFSGYMQIHIAHEDQHKTTFTCPFGTFAYTRMPFGLCNVPSTFQRCMTSIFSDLLQDCIEVFMDNFTVYDDSFDHVLTRCIDTNLVLNFEKCDFMVTEGIVLGYLVSNKGIEVDKSKIDIITSLPNPASVWENFSKIVLPLSKLLQKDVDFKFDHPCIEAFQELKNQLTSTPILQAPN
ncbi:Retrovirus-related Pol polyprotein, partial [Mucuna pruriens]